MAAPIRLGASAYFKAAWASSPTVWTLAAYLRLNNSGTASFPMTRGRSDATDGVIGVYGSASGAALDIYVQTSSGGFPSSDGALALVQTDYNTGSVLVPMMLTRNGGTTKLYTPSTPSGVTYSIGALAGFADLASAGILTFGAWERNGTPLAGNFADADIDEMAAWTNVVGTASEYAELVAKTTLPEAIGDGAFQAALHDVWSMQLSGSAGSAVSNGTTFAGLVNGTTLTLIGTTGVVSARAQPLVRSGGGGGSAKPANYYAQQRRSR